MTGSSDEFPELLRAVQTSAKPTHDLRRRANHLRAIKAGLVDALNKLIERTEVAASKNEAALNRTCTQALIALRRQAFTADVNQEAILEKLLALRRAMLDLDATEDELLEAAGPVLRMHRRTPIVYRANTQWIAGRLNRAPFIVVGDNLDPEIVLETTKEIAYRMPLLESHKCDPFHFLVEQNVHLGSYFIGELLKNVHNSPVTYYEVTGALARADMRPADFIPDV